MAENLYTLKGFNERLKKARLYRGYQYQSTACKKANITRQCWSLYELGKRVPSLELLAIIADSLQMRVEYFFIEDADPADYSLLYEEDSPK